MKVKKLENLWDKFSLTGCKWSSLNPPSTETPMTHPFWGESLFLHFPLSWDSSYKKVHDSHLMEKYHYVYQCIHILERVPNESYSRSAWFLFICNSIFGHISAKCWWIFFNMGHFEDYRGNHMLRTQPTEGIKPKYTTAVNFLKTAARFQRT